MKFDDTFYFDRAAPYSVVQRVLPHWAQPGTLCFVTWRLADSLPKDALRSLDAEFAEIRRAESVLARTDLPEDLRKHASVARGRARRKLFTAREKFLDAGYGCCRLAKPRNAEEVLKSWQCFDEQRYFLTDAVVMPNHVHFIAAFGTDESMLSQCEAWKRFTARKINAAEGVQGAFWQHDQFDHLVRSEEQFEHYRRYIKNNPQQAGLNEGEYLWFQKDLTSRRVT